MSTDHEFTEAEQTAIEKAAGRLEHVLVNLDAIDAAYDIASEIRDELVKTALAEVRKNQIALAHAYQHTAKREEGRVDEFQWTPSHSLAYAQGEARGAVNAFQILLMQLGEVEFDEAAECTWDIVSNWRTGGSR